jgi:23S rRNA (guanosine2251-2'-O)-methyltransferase
MAERDSSLKSNGKRDGARPHAKGGKPQHPQGERHSERDGRDKRSEHDGRSSRPPGNLYWLYGGHAVLAALANPKRKIRRLELTPEAAKTHADAIAAARALRPLPGDSIIEKPELERQLPPNAVHQGIAALVEPLPAMAIEDLARLAATRERAVVIVLDQVTDPHNVGAILRSAAAFGALAVVVPDRHSPDETGALAKAASGALERMPVVRVTNVVRTLNQLKEAGFWTAGLAGESPLTLASQKLTGRIALVMGAEGEGLRRLTREHCDYLVKLPMADGVESLNVSNACAVALYELVRDIDLA